MVYVDANMCVHIYSYIVRFYCWMKCDFSNTNRRSSNLSRPSKLLFSYLTPAEHQGLQFG